MIRKLRALTATPCSHHTAQLSARWVSTHLHTHTFSLAGEGEDVLSVFVLQRLLLQVVEEALSVELSGCFLVGLILLAHTRWQEGILGWETYHSLLSTASRKKQRYDFHPSKTNRRETEGDAWTGQDFHLSKTLLTNEHLVV